MKDLSNLINDINKREVALKHLISLMPSISGTICVKEIKNNFKIKQGVWQKRSPVTNEIYDYNRTASYRTPKLGKKSIYKNPYKGSVVSSKNPILLQTRNLRDSIIFKVIGNDVAIGVFHRTKKVGDRTIDSMNYGQIHNEGGSVRMFGKKTVRMPRRKFMPTPSEGPTATMKIAIKQKYDKELNLIMGSWKI